MHRLPCHAPPKTSPESQTLGQSGEKEDMVKRLIVDGASRHFDIGNEALLFRWGNILQHYLLLLTSTPYHRHKSIIPSSYHSFKPTSVTPAHKCSSLTKLSSSSPLHSQPQLPSSPCFPQLQHPSPHHPTQQPHSSQAASYTTVESTAQ